MRRSTRRTHRPLLMAVAIPMACAGGSGSADSVAAASDAAKDVRITLERGACFGPCPMYRLELDGSGRVRYEGRSFVRDSGVREDTVSADTVRALATEMERAGYFAFEEKYPPDATDHATVITSLTIDGRTRRIEHNLGSRSAPAGLEALYARIDEVARSAKWIGEPQTGPPVEGGTRRPVPADSASR